MFIKFKETSRGIISEITIYFVPVTNCIKFHHLIITKPVHHDHVSFLPHRQKLRTAELMLDNLPVRTFNT